MNWVFSKLETLGSKMDGITMHNQLENPQHPEVIEFIRNYHVLAFELARYHRSGAHQNMEVELCKGIVERINKMNEFLLFYQSSTEDNALFNIVSVMRDHYHMDQLLQTRNEIQQRLIAEEQRQQVIANQSMSYYVNTTTSPLMDVHMIPMPPTNF